MKVKKSSVATKKQRYDREVDKNLKVKVKHYQDEKYISVNIKEQSLKQIEIISGFVEKENKKVLSDIIDKLPQYFIEEYCMGELGSRRQSTNPVPCFLPQTLLKSGVYQLLKINEQKDIINLTNRKKIILREIERLEKIKNKLKNHIQIRKIEDLEAWAPGHSLPLGSRRRYSSLSGATKHLLRRTRRRSRYIPKLTFSEAIVYRDLIEKGYTVKRTYGKVGYPDFTITQGNKKSYVEVKDSCTATYTPSQIKIIPTLVKKGKKILIAIVCPDKIKYFKCEELFRYRKLFNNEKSVTKFIPLKSPNQKALGNGESKFISSVSKTN